MPDIRPSRDWKSECRVKDREGRTQQQSHFKIREHEIVLDRLDRDSDQHAICPRKDEDESQHREADGTKVGFAKRSLGSTSLRHIVILVGIAADYHSVE